MSRSGDLPTVLSYKNYVAGWLDTSVDAFLEDFSASSESTQYALITCLDSNLNPATLRKTSPELKSIASKFQVLGSGLLIRTELLLNANARQRIFFGFDEIWFFPTKSIQPKPTTLSLVGPARLTQARVNKIGKWASENSCSLALGGGEGLNYLVQAHGPVRYLLRYSMEQPEPALASAS